MRILSLQLALMWHGRNHESIYGNDHCAMIAAMHLKKTKAAADRTVLHVGRLVTRPSRNLVLQQCHEAVEMTSYS